LSGSDYMCQVVQCLRDQTHGKRKALNEWTEIPMVKLKVI